MSASVDIESSETDDIKNLIITVGISMLPLIQPELHLLPVLGCRLVFPVSDDVGIQFIETGDPQKPWRRIWNFDSICATKELQILPVWMPPCKES